MMLLIYIYIFILGLVLGSFYNVVGLRVADKQSIVTPRSHCPACSKTLKWYELLPVLSFIIQKGQCRHCGNKVSPIYPFFELLTGLLFVFSFYKIGLQLELFIAWLLVSLLIIITVSDLYKQIIPDYILLFFLVSIILMRIWIPTDPWYDAYLAAIIGFVLLLVIAIVSKGGMGGGDIKLFGVLGLFLGVQGTLMTLFLSSLIGAVVGVILMMFGKVKRGVPIPFGPFIAISALIAYFYSKELIDWYLRLMM
ncbi:prepilin peptidase [Alkalibacillus haloalkaliphilus]|uniref:prepilin peptidase n=1 Tax=Alkalibacillus haloalkaliphilus TaxID=94136 RepID=UPI0029358A61|nr:prepilin peptidase [Alkalibacillus haloalkaliphilus]MDV2581860.1 prepilin peptidase [Alkalibacillus haloalkaliphilus]